MKSVAIESKRVRDVSITHVKYGSIEVTMKQVGECKVIATEGRGNVRQVKSIARLLHKSILQGGVNVDS